MHEVWPLATAAELVMAPSAARPETAGARKDAPAAADEASFAEVLDAEVQTTETETLDDANAAVGAPAAAPAPTQPAPATAGAVELLISLQSADAPVVRPEVAATEAVTAAPAPASAAMPIVDPVADPAIATAPNTPVEATPATPIPAPQSTTAVPPEMQDGSQRAAQIAAANGAAPTVAAAAPKAAQAVAADTEQELAGDADAAPAPGPVDATKAVAGNNDAAASVAVTADSPATPPAQAATAPAQAVVAAAVAPTPKPTSADTAQPAEETAPKIQPASSREAPPDETQTASTKPGASASSSASASQTPNNVMKPQGGVQTIAADAAPAAKADAPTPTSFSTSTSFADLLAAARGTPADAGKPAATHPALQSAPQTVVQVYARFVERFDGRAQRFEVSLTPAELGRVDVRIEIGADKKVHAVLAAHDSAALTDLMRGQRALERALADAGIDLKGGGVKFELANDPGRGLAGQEQRRDARQDEDANVWRGFSTTDVAVESDASITVRSYRPVARLDLVA